jgi:surface protein
MKKNSDICIIYMKYILLFFDNGEGNIYLKNKGIKDNQIPKCKRNIYFNKKKSNLRKEIKISNIKSFSNLILLLNIILLLFPLCLAYKNPNLRKLNNISEITLTIDGIGEQKIIYNSFYATPSKVIVNDIIMEEPGKTVNCTKEKGNIIKMEFNESLNTAFNMFSRLSNITKIDLSKFDASQITEMNFMFNECQNLEYIDLTNINTSSVTDMSDLFCKCTKLTSIDLSYFDTSSVTNFVFLFYHCSSLKSVNL